MKITLPVLTLFLLVSTCLMAKVPYKNGQYLLIKTTCSKVDSTGTLLGKDSLNTYSYAPGSAKMTGITATVWDSATRKYLPNTYDSFIYDANGLLTEHISQIYNGTKYYNFGQELHYYDSTGLDTLLVTKTWNSSSKTWDNAFMERHSYNSSLMKDRFIELQWIKKRWTLSTRTSYTYNKIGNTDKTLLEMWNGTSWDSIQLLSYTYNTSNVLTQILTSDLSPGTSTNNSRALYSYGTSGQQMNILNQFWDGSSWQMNTKNTLNYTTDGNLSDQSFFIYDLNSHKVTSAEHCVYSYQLYTGLKEERHIEEDILVFPVPVRNELSIYSPANGLNYFEAYTASGQLHERKNILGQSTFDASKWPAGIYILKLYGKDGSTTIRKIVKE